MTSFRVPLACLVLLISVWGFLHGASPLDGQELGGDCEPQSFRVLNSQELAVGQRVTWIGLPDVVCPDGVRIRADSAIVWEAAERTEFIGRFRYEDPERELQSDDADYFEREGRLFARGQVELRSRDGETVVRGDTLNLYEGNEGAGDDRLDVTGGRAFALLQPGDSTGGVEGSDPYEVWAQRIRFEGERFFFGEGDVEVVRDSLRATASTLSFDRSLGSVLLVGDARVLSGETETEGRTITLELPDDELTAMVARGGGRLTSEELELFGEEIQVDFEDGAMHHLLAIRWLSTEDAGPVEPDVEFQEESPRPEAFAEDFYLTGDSLEVEAPGGSLETVFAYGRARGEAQVPGMRVVGREPQENETTDGVSADSLEVTSADPDGIGIRFEILDHDWIEGDTIVATFIGVEGPPEESLEGQAGASEYALDRLVAVGNARTLYRSPPEEEGTHVEVGPPPGREEWAVSYLLADQIVLEMVDGRVEHVLAEGSVSGIQLEPEELPPDGPPIVEEVEDIGVDR